MGSKPTEGARGRLFSTQGNQIAIVCRAFRFFSRQCFASILVAFESHTGFAARSTTSTAAKYFGAFGAGLPNGSSSFAATNGAISCSWKPSRSAVSELLRRAGNRRQFSKANFSCVVAADPLASMSPSTFLCQWIPRRPRMRQIN